MTLRSALTKQRWCLLVRKRRFTPGSRAQPDGYQPMLPPRDRFYADPCLVTHAGEDFLFFEEYRYVRSLGSIACMTLDSNGNPTRQTVVLERRYHLSFPFVFSWSGTMW